MNWLYRQKAALEKRFFPGRSKRWRRWKDHDPANPAAIDHALLAEFLDRYVRPMPDGSTRIAYGEVLPPDVGRLDRYLAACAALPIGAYNRAEQFAFWANVYNGATVRLVLAHYPMASIRRIGFVPIWLGGGPWNRPAITIEGVALSLNDIEHRVLRRNWRDPLIHYAVNCASLGCPSLGRYPFSGAGLDGQLDAVARAFVNSDRGVRPESDGIAVCSIYVWFREDFGSSDAGIIDHLRRYADPPLAERLTQTTRIVGHRYDWGLNDAASPQP